MWCVPQSIWQAWTSRRRSMMQDWGTLQKIWGVLTNTHGWIISAFLREMAELEEPARFECVEGNFLFNRCLCQGKRRSSQIVAKKNGHAAVGKCGGNLEKEKSGHLLRFGRAKST